MSTRHSIQLAEDGTNPRSELAAELAVLASVLLDNDTLSTVAGILSEEDFYHPAHGLIFVAMTALQAKNQPIDIITLAGELRSMGRLNAVGGPQYLGELTDNIPTTVFVEAHARIVLEAAISRRLVDQARIVVMSAGNTNLSSVDLAHQMRLSADAATDRQPRSSMTRVDDAVMEAMTRLEQQFSGATTTITGIQSGLRDLDDLLGGFRSGQVTIVAGRPAMGKTSLALQILVHAASVESMVARAENRGPKAVVLFSLEMERHELINHLLCSMARVDRQSLKKGIISQEQLDALMVAANRLSSLCMYIDDSAHQTLATIHSAVRAVERKHGGVLLTEIDYIGLMRGGGKFESREQEMGHISRGLKGMAKDFSMHVIPLAQLNRRCEERPDHRPLLSDLRESGSMEADADNVLMIYRDEYYNKQSQDRGIAEINIAKQRNGPSEVVRARFIGATTTFDNLAEDVPSIPDVAPRLSDEGGEF